MAKHGESKHFKRSVVTNALVIPRKKYKYYTKPLPGKHSSKEGVSLLGFLRDVLKIASNAREARYLIKNGKVYVDGKRISEEKYVVGFSDIVSIKEDFFLVWLDKRGKIIALKMDGKQNTKSIKVMSKHSGKKGANVLFTNDARNIVYDKDDIQIGDSIKFDFLNKTIIGKLPFEQGRKIIVFRGKNAGKTGKIKEIVGSMTFIEGNDEEFVASSDSCMVVE